MYQSIDGDLSSRRRTGETKVCTNALTKAEQESGDLWVAECSNQSPQQICPRSDYLNSQHLSDFLCCMDRGLPLQKANVADQEN